MGHVSRHERLLWSLAAIACWALAAHLIRTTWLYPQKDATWRHMQDSGVLRVGLDASFAPFETVDAAGQVAGYDVDLVSELAARWGVRAEFINISFDGLYDALTADKCDILCSALPYDPALTQDVLYSPSYFNAGLLVVVKADQSSIRSTADLGGRGVGVELATAGHLQARWLVEQARIPLLITTYDTADGALQALRNGEVAAAIVDSGTAYRFARDPGGITWLNEFLTDEQYVLAMPLHSGYLWKRTSDDLATLSRDGFLDQLRTKWF
jgi:ABC-type amino acid transport substrate-binding protein